jgi:hypothetical protein
MLDTARLSLPSGRRLAACLSALTDGSSPDWHHERMGVMYDYFSAASDEAAASAIDLVGRPGASDGPLFDSLPTTGIDPGVPLGTLASGFRLELLAAVRSHEKSAFDLGE